MSKKNRIFHVNEPTLTVSELMMIGKFIYGGGVNYYEPLSGVETRLDRRGKLDSQGNLIAEEVYFISKGGFFLLYWDHVVAFVGGSVADMQGESMDWSGHPLDGFRYWMTAQGCEKEADKGFKVVNLHG